MSPIQGILTMKNVSRNVCFLYVFIGCELKIFKDWWILYLLVISLWRKCNSSLYLSEHTFNTCTKFFVKETLSEMFSWGFCKNSKNIFLQNTFGQLLLFLVAQKCNKPISCHQSLSIPCKNINKPVVFVRFQGVQKGTSGIKWVNISLPKSHDLQVQSFKVRKANLVRGHLT